jgi:asparagine synthase (glutamine-hydrolysing)
MCGIAGIGNWIEPPRLAAALERMRHRGPDAQGYWTGEDPHVALGHLRLSILDLDSRANQPMVCPRTGNVLVFNGEIYNFRELRRQLEASGWIFRTTSDSEVLLAAYGQWGTTCPEHLNGMFAFTVYDPAHRQFFMARDRVGKKPLYYARAGSRLAFASELKGLLELCPGLSRELDPEALAAYLELGYIAGELSVYREVRKLPPAHWATFNLADGVWELRRYWSLPAPGSSELDEAQALDTLEELLDDAVRLRLQSDVPVGVFLSGGLDSSLVAAFVARQRPELVAYTAAFSDPRFDESPHAAKVAQWLGLPHHILPVTADDGGALEELGRQFDEPFADSSLLPTFLISRAIRQEVTVALSGDGGDELFAGYQGYAAAVEPEPLQGWPLPLRRLLGLGHRLLPTGVPGKNFLRRLPLAPLEQFLLRSRSQEALPPWPLRPSLAAGVAGLDGDRFRRQVLAGMSQQWGDLPLVQQMTRLDFLSYLPDDILVKVDRASMLTSLEVRSPLLDYRIAEFAFALSGPLRYAGGGKYLLRRLGKRYLPPDFAYGRKQGFSIPESAWLRGDWRELPARLAAGSALVEPTALARLQAAHDRSGRLGVPLFRLLMLLQFERNYGPFA